MAHRLTWLTPDPAATRLRLGPLADAIGTCVALRRPAPHEPLAAKDERLVLEEDPAALPALPTPALVGVGWATLELEAGGAALVDERLAARGAICPERICGAPVALLEPVAEGLLTAALARFGPGPVAVYLREPNVDPADGPGVGPPRASPFGKAVLVEPARPWGPFVFLVGR